MHRLTTSPDGDQSPQFHISKSKRSRSCAAGCAAAQLLSSKD